ncbi:hypothetical protein M514_01680 [Trichuris suis]|uniref:Uncharacterized protein n=1 Tax=Trichuris suis TaxID=68888 RepID=A0A085N5W9_9BILA|nr:hypothetical protein M513_01680 [Trichuris suis]KFD64865.1 hypothetical protein M514_01680 [Trichuris suis]
MKMAYFYLHIFEFLTPSRVELISSSIRHLPGKKLRIGEPAHAKYLPLKLVVALVNSVETALAQRNAIFGGKIKKVKPLCEMASHGTKFAERIIVLSPIADVL